MVEWSNVYIPRNTRNIAGETYSLCYRIYPNIWHTVFTFNVSGPAVEVQTCLAKGMDHCVMHAFNYENALGSAVS